MQNKLDIFIKAKLSFLMMDASSYLITWRFLRDPGTVLSEWITDDMVSLCWYPVSSSF